MMYGHIFARICHIWHMRTTLDLDDWILQALLERHPGASKTQVIEQALKSYLETDAIARA